MKKCVFLILSLFLSLTILVGNAIAADTDGDGRIDSEDFCPEFMPVHLVRGDAYYPYLDGLQSAYNMDMQDLDIVQAQHLYVEDPLVLNRGIDVTIQGGYNCDFTDNTVLPAISLIESLTIGSLSGSVTLENISIGWHGTH